MKMMMFPVMKTEAVIPSSDSSLGLKEQQKTKK